MSKRVFTDWDKMVTARVWTTSVTPDLEYPTDWNHYVWFIVGHGMVIKGRHSYMHRRSALRAARKARATLMRTAHLIPIGKLQ